MDVGFQDDCREQPDAFAAAKANADRVGFTFGNCEGYGQGAQATFPVTVEASNSSPSACGPNRGHFTP